MEAQGGVASATHSSKRTKHECSDESCEIVCWSVWAYFCTSCVFWGGSGGGMRGKTSLNVRSYDPDLESPSVIITSAIFSTAVLPPPQSSFSQETCHAAPTGIPQCPPFTTTAPRPLPSPSPYLLCLLPPSPLRPPYPPSRLSSTATNAHCVPQHPPPRSLRPTSNTRTSRAWRADTSR